MKPSKTKAEHQAQLIQRFSRQLILKGVGKAGQEAWLRAQVQVDGEGPAAWIAQRYLAAAGIKVGSGSGHALRVDLREEEAADPLSEAVRGVEAARSTLLALLPGTATGDEPTALSPTESDPKSGLGDPSKTGDPLVVVVGAGGLGCPALLGLLWAGVRRFRVIDDDVVELSNLPRQILHGEQDLGRAKAISATEALLSLGGTSIEVDPRTERLSPGNIEKLFAGADLVIEASDNFPTKFRINAATRLLGIPAVIGGVIRFEGQTLALPAGSGKKACYRCFFPQSPAPGALPTCSSAGVLGPVAGAVGLHQAQLGMALLRGESVEGSLALYDGQSGLWTSLSGRPDPDCIACGPNPDEPALRGAASSGAPTSC